MLVIYYDIIVLKLHCDIAHFWKGMLKILSIHILKKSFSYICTNNMHAMWCFKF